jgi:multiple sugar transport system ATP-binding protein
MIAGLENITSGDISIGGRVVNTVPPKDRDVAMVFQNYSLYPHMTVFDNMAFSLKLAGAPNEIKQREVRRAAQILGLEQLLHRYPRQLSGGQRQRVAMGRAIVRDPQVFLFDEPLSNLDAKLRVQMRSEIKALHQRLRVTTVYVTHDQIEAMTMADKIVVLNAGNIEQVGSPLELYNNPANLFVAGFIGSPRMNLIKPPAGSPEKAATIGVRPEDVALSRDSGAWSGKVRIAEHLGSDTFFHIDVDEVGPITARAPGEFGLFAGDTIRITPNPDRIHRFDKDGKEIRQ